MSHNELIKLNEKEMVLTYMYAVLNINHYEHLILLSTYFLFSLISSYQLRMEKLAAKSRSSQAKVIGSIISIAGAFVCTFYKGPSIFNAYTHLSSALHQPIHFVKSEDGSWTIASILLIADYFLVSLWYILQVGLGLEFK